MGARFDGCCLLSQAHVAQRLHLTQKSFDQKYPQRDQDVCMCFESEHTCVRLRGMLDASLMMIDDRHMGRAARLFKRALLLSYYRDLTRPPQLRRLTATLIIHSNAGTTPIFPAPYNSRSQVVVF